MKLLSVLLWIPFIPLKIALAAVGLVVVPVGLKLNKLPRLFTSTRNIPTFHENAIRNPVDGMKFWFDQPEEYTLFGNTHSKNMEPHLQTEPVTWQFRHSGWWSSFRVVWQYNDVRYGEFFLGWKLGMEAPAMDFAMQFRPWATVGN